MPTDSFIQLPDDSTNTGKKVRSHSEVIGGDTVHTHVFVPAIDVAGSDTPVNAGNPMPVAGSVAVSSTPGLTDVELRATPVPVTLVGGAELFTDNFTGDGDGAVHSLSTGADISSVSVGGTGGSAATFDINIQISVDGIEFSDAKFITDQTISNYLTLRRVYNFQNPVRYFRISQSNSNGSNDVTTWASPEPAAGQLAPDGRQDVNVGVSLVNPSHAEDDFVGLPIGGWDGYNYVLQGVHVAPDGSLSVNQRPQGVSASVIFAVDTEALLVLGSAPAPDAKGSPVEDHTLGQGIATFHIYVNASPGFAGTVVFEALPLSGDWVSVYAYPPIGSPTTSIDYDDSGIQSQSWQIPVSGYIKVRARCSAATGSGSFEYLALATSTPGLHSQRVLLSDGTNFASISADGELKLNGVIPGTGVDELGKRAGDTVTGGEVGAYMLALDDVNSIYSPLHIDDEGFLRVRPGPNPSTDPLYVGATRSTASEVFTSAIAGSTQNWPGLTAGTGKFSLQVKQTGTVTSWTVLLEASLDNSTWTTVLTHTKVTPGDGLIIGTVTGPPALYWRVRCSALVLGAGTYIAVSAVGLNN